MAQVRDWPKACFPQIRLEPFRNHCSTTNTSDPRTSSYLSCYPHENAGLGPRRKQKEIRKARHCDHIPPSRERTPLKHHAISQGKRCGSYPKAPSWKMGLPSVSIQGQKRYERSRQTKLMTQIKSKGANRTGIPKIHKV